MLTIREAIQRLSMYSMVVRRYTNGKWIVLFAEDRTDDSGYVTDDLDDAVIEGGRMRKRRLQSI